MQSDDMAFLFPRHFQWGQPPSLLPWWDSDSVIQLSEASGVSGHLDLLIPRFRLLLLVSRGRVQHCITGDGHLSVR